MTRETKVGLIVAGSFVCLVSVVIASKWNRDPDAGKEPEEQTVQVAAAKPTQDANAKKPPEAKKSDPKKADPAPVPHVFPPLPAAPDIKNPSPGMVDIGKLPPLVLPPPVGDDAIKRELEKQKLEAMKQTKTDVIQFPAGDQGAIKFPSDPVVIPQPIVQAQDKDKQPGAIFPPIDDKKPGAIGFPPIDDKRPGAIGFPPIDDKKPGAIGFPPIDDKKPGAIGFPPIDDKKAGLPDPLQPGGIGVLPLPPLDKKPDPLQPGGVGIVPPFDKKPDAIAPFNGQDPILPKDPLSKPIIGVPTPPDNNPIVGIKPIEPVDSTPKVIPRIGSGDLVTPPISIGPGGKPPLPVVKDVNSTYNCELGVSNFNVASMRLYGTDKYGDALLQYNRDHQRYSKSQALLGASPTLTAGQPIEHPPLEILHRDYASRISGGVPTIPPMPAVKLVSPGAIDPGIAKISNPTPAVGGRTYTVQNAGGESILDIAERALGNRSQWTEIYRINQTNPAVRPPALVPAGTSLKLPGN